MKKVFKLGTALALTVLVNFAPIMLPDVKAESTVSSTNTDIVVEEKQQIIYAEEVSEAFVSSEVIEEVSAPNISPNNEISSAEANNVLKSAPTRAPTEETTNENLNSTDQVGLLGVSEEPTRDAEEPENHVVRIHIKDNRTGEYKDYKTYEYEAGTSIGDNVKNGLNMYSIFGLGTQYSASTTKFTEGDYTYTFEGWYLDENNANAFTNTSGVPNSDFESGFSRFAISTSTSYPYGIRVNVLNELEATKDYYIYANWVKSVTPKVIVNWHDSVYTLNGTKTVNSGSGSSLPSGTIPETVTVNGKKYNFLGWSLTENGELIDNVTINGDDEDPNNDVPLEYRPNYRKVMVTAKTALQTVETVDLYAIWEEEYVPEPHKLTINYWDVKPDGTYIAKTISNNISPGVTWTQRLPIDQIFDAQSDRPYTGFNKNSNTNIEKDKSENPRREYTLLGWYDAETNGTKIDDNYVLNADYLKGLTAISTENDGPWAISFTSRNVLDEDVVINFYAYWDVYYYPVLTFNRIDNLAHGSSSMAIPSGSNFKDGYKHTFKKPADIPSGYEFMYWKFDDNNDQTDDTKLYYAGDEFTYSFQDSEGNYLYESGWTGTITAYAWYQPSVTLQIFKDDSSTGTQNRIYFDESTIEKGNKVTVAEKPEAYGYTRTGYDFVGYFTKVNGEEVAVPLGTVYEALPASYEEPDKTVPVNVPLTYNIYAKWERTTKNVAITKEWNDEGREEYRPESLTLNVYATDSEGNKTLYKEVTLEGEGNTWTSEEFTIYPFDKQGNAITYTVEEQSIDCYQTTTEDWTLTENGLTIENTINEDGKVTIIYQTVDGQIFEQSEINKPIDADFTAQPKTYENYALDRVEVNGNEVEDPTINGKITEEEQTIVYYYDITIGNVYIYHVDPEGHLIDVDRDGIPVENFYIAETRNIGDSYADIAVPKTIAGYKHNAKASTNFSGDKLVTKKDTHIFFVYDPIGKVVVKYLEQGTDAVLAEQTNKEGVVGTEYATAAKTDITNYQLVTDPDHTSGIYTAESYYEPEVIIYYYELKDSNLYVHHIDVETGDNLVDPIISSEKIGTPYETSRLDGEEYDIYDVVRTEGNLEGEYAAEDIHVYYYYQKQKGTVTAYYIDNKSLQPIVDPVTTEGYVNETYSTERTEFPGYRFVNVNDESLESGNYRNGEDIKVYYFYEKVGTVIIKHLDVDTNEDLVIVDPKVGAIDAEYTTSSENIEGYHYVGVEGDPFGTYTEEGQTVIYYYEKDFVYGELVVNYLDMDGNPIEDYSYTDTQVVGTVYNTEAIEIPGYEYKFVTGDKPEGEYEEGTLTISYVYDKIEEIEEPIEAYVLVHYMAGTTPLADDVIITGYVGEEFITETKAFPGYTLVNITKEVPNPRRGAIPDYMANAYGEFVEGVTVVTYQYEKIEEETTEPEDAVVISHYVDENGNAIANDEYFFGKVGDKYYTSQKVIPGYTGSEIPGNKNGVMEEPLTEVTYKYTKNEEEEPSGDDSCNNCCCNNCCSCNNNCNNEGEGESNQPIINIDITINNDNSTEVNNENNNQDENNNNIENNPVNNNEITTGDTNVTTGDTTVTTGDVNIENNPTVENNTEVTTGDVTIENNPTNNVDNSTSVENNPTNTVATGDTTVEIGDITNTSNATNGEITNTNTAEGGSNENNNSTEIKDNTITNNVEGGNSENNNTNESTTGDNTTNVTTGDNTQDTATGDNTNDNTSDNVNENNNTNDNTTPCSGEACEPSEGASDDETEDPVYGTVVANFLDEDGNVIANKVMESKKVNTPYTTNAKDIEDYELVEVKGDESGKYIDGEIKVDYIYKKKEVAEPTTGTVVAHYINDLGQKLRENVTTTGTTDVDDYNTQLKSFKDYSFVQVVGQTSGKYPNGQRDVYYIYKTVNSNTPDTTPEPTPNVKPEPETGYTTGTDTITYKTANRVEITTPNTGIDNTNYGLIMFLIISVGGFVYSLKKVFE